MFNTPTPAQAPSSALLAALAQRLPASSILAAPEQKKPYECDGLTGSRQEPMLVVLPENIDQVADVLRICAEQNVPIVPRGAGTGVSGGAQPRSDGVVVGFSKLTAIIDIDPVKRRAVVEPGVRNLAISEATKPYGLYYAPDPSSQIACSIGGNVAENAGGVHCLKYGLTVHNIVELKVLTSTGELLTLGGSGLDNAGYDLLAGFIGSEGLLGLVVEVTVALRPIPEAAQVMLAAFDSVTAAADAVAAVIAAGITPGGLEMMDQLALIAAEDFAHAGYPKDAAAILLCELDGTPAEIEEELAIVRKVMETHEATLIRLSQSEAERAQLWAGRKAAFPAVGRIAPDYYCMDGTIPRKQLGAMLEFIDERAKHYELQVANVFHAGDGNLHPLILYDASKAGETDRAEALGTEILEHCVTVGGTITGEHGVGIEKLNPMCKQFAGAEIEQFERLKAAFDPLGILNPGKAMPTLSRCAEIGGMHIHAGELPFPELERF